MAIHAEAVEILVRKGRFEPEVAVSVAEAIEVSITLTQVVTVPVLDARLQDLRQDIKSDFAEMRAEMVREFAKMRAEMAIEFGKVAHEFGKVRAEMAHEFGKVRAEMATESGAVRTEMARGFGKAATETKEVKAELMRWVLLTLVSSAAISAAVSPFLKDLIK